MLQCLRPSPAPVVQNFQLSPPPLQGDSADGTPRSSSQPSPAGNFTSEYMRGLQTSSYSEIRIHLKSFSDQEIGPQQWHDNSEHEKLSLVLHPNRECVQEALRCVKPSTLTQLVSDYFNQTERTSRLCLLIHNSIRRARFIYAPLNNHLADLSLDSESDTVTNSQCSLLFDLFLSFDKFENPFSNSESNNFNDMRNCFLELKQQLNTRIGKSKDWVRLLCCATISSAICLIGTGVGVAISAAVIVGHAFVAIVAGPCMTAFLPSTIKKKELSRRAQLDAAKRGTCVLHYDLDTINRLVTLLHTEIESDKLLVRLGLERGEDRNSIQEVAKQLKRNYLNLEHYLDDLEEHLCFCFDAINNARSLLLQQISLHRTDNV